MKPFFLINKKSSFLS
jgi:hypothetical protein